MHELSIALSIVDGVQAEAEARGITRVTAVNIKLGPLSGVVKEALLFAYPLAAEGTLLEGSRLEFETAPVIIFCPRCQREMPPVSGQELSCTACHSPAERIVSGADLEVLAFEIPALDTRTPEVFQDEPASIGGSQAEGPEAK